MADHLIIQPASCKVAIFLALLHSLGLQMITFDRSPLTLRVIRFEGKKRAFTFQMLFLFFHQNEKKGGGKRRGKGEERLRKEMPFFQCLTL